MSEEKLAQRLGTEQMLKGRNWFRQTALPLRQTLLGLPETFNGALEQIARRPEVGGGVRIVRLANLDIPSYPSGAPFGLFVNFEVIGENDDLENPQKNFCYQYHIWKQGPASGTKGVILVVQKGQVTHVGCMRGFSFAIGAETDDCVGGFADKPELKLSDQFLQEVKEEFLPGAVVRQTIDLGTFYPDRGQTANEPSLAAVVIGTDESAKVLKGRHVNPDPYEMKAGPILIPVAHLWGSNGFAASNKDGYFTACLCRLVALGAIKPPDDLKFDFSA